ncbi:MAG: rhomboid family intramembrane serine protease [Bryobacterales bacterium]|nr:rhomboid family intramembrane serine protease [Bryobacterales bacterium]
MIPLRDTHPSNSRPWVVMGLIAMNLIAFGIEIATPAASMRGLFETWAIVPDRFAWHTLGTYMFLHAGWMHLIGNMWFLWIFGDNVEDALGPARFLSFYLVCGAAAGLVHFLAEPGSPIPTVGASGAIAGVMGAYMVKFPHSRILTLVPIIIFFTTVEIPAVFMLLYWFLIQVVSGAYAAGSTVVSGGTAWFAHIGGFLVGALLGWLLKSRESPLGIQKEWEG